MLHFYNYLFSVGRKLSILDLKLTEGNYTVAKDCYHMAHRIAQLLHQQQSIRSNWFPGLERSRTIGQALLPRACLSWIGEKGAGKVPSSGLSGVVVG